MMKNPLLLSFLNTYSLSLSSFGCKACAVINSEVSEKICLSSSQNVSVYLTIVTVQVFIPLMRFRSLNSFSWSFLVRLIFLSFISTCLMVSISNFRKFIFFETVLILGFFFFRLGSSFPSWHIFLCQIPFLYPECIFGFFVCESLLHFSFWRPPCT